MKNENYMIYFHLLMVVNRLQVMQTLFLQFVVVEVDQVPANKTPLFDHLQLYKEPALDQLMKMDNVLYTTK